MLGGGGICAPSQCYFFSNQSPADLTRRAPRTRSRSLAGARIYTLWPTRAADCRGRGDTVRRPLAREAQRRRIPRLQVSECVV